MTTETCNRQPFKGSILDAYGRDRAIVRLYLSWDGPAYYAKFVEDLRGELEFQKTLKKYKLFSIEKPQGIGELSEGEMEQLRRMYPGDIHKPKQTRR